MAKSPHVHVLLWPSCWGSTALTTCPSRLKGGHRITELDPQRTKIDYFLYGVFIHYIAWTQDVQCLDLFAGQQAVSKGFSSGLRKISCSFKSLFYTLAQSASFNQTIVTSYWVGDVCWKSMWCTLSAVGSESKKEWKRSSLSFSRMNIFCSNNVHMHYITRECCMVHYLWIFIYINSSQLSPILHAGLPRSSFDLELQGEEGDMTTVLRP